MEMSWAGFSLPQSSLVKPVYIDISEKEEERLGGHESQDEADIQQRLWQAQRTKSAKAMRKRAENI